MLKKNATFSSMVLIHTRKWLRVIQEHSTKALKYSMFHLGLNPGGQMSMMKTKTSAEKLFAGADIRLNLKPPVAVQYLTTTTYFTFTQSLDKPYSTSHTGMQDYESLMFLSRQQFQILKESLGHKMMK